MTPSISNPILRGFNPDPSIIRVEDDFYIATSTFEWYPGVQIHHSKDLIHWRLLTRPLNRESQLNMLGNPDSCGVWAPCLTFSDGIFYLVYTDVKRYEGNFKDTHNYLVMAESITGPWSDPIYLNSSGFDPSLFHDDNGRKWLVNMIWDHRPDRSFFGGVLLQEFDRNSKKLTGPIYNIFKGSSLGYTEGPHLYQFNNMYYLITAEGGTGPNHAVTMARSKTITGPYEIHPDKHIVTSKDNPKAELRRAGHGDLVELKDGSIYLVHLCSRPLKNTGTSPMGRETAIQKMSWGNDGWLRKADHNVSPDIDVPAPDLDQKRWESEAGRTEFESMQLPVEFQWLRTPWPEELYSLTLRPGWLRLFGHESLGSWFKQALIARRQQSLSFTAQTRLEFEPETFQQMAGLVCYYNSHKYFYLYISHDEAVGKHIGIMNCLADTTQKSVYPLQSNPIVLTPGQPVSLRVGVTYENLEFSWSLDENTWDKIDITLNAGLLSDEAGRGEDANFTGAFVGMCAQDLSGCKKYADFKYFEYRDTGPG